MDHYKPLSEEEWANKIDFFKSLITNFIEINGYAVDDIQISETAVFQIITKVDQRKQYFEYFHYLEISEFKEVALYCFWIIKEKPLFFSKQDASDDEKMAFESLNEKFALYCIIAEFRALAGGNKEKQNRINHLFSKEYIYELVYTFTYRDISKEAMIMLVETMAIALGFSPYREE